MSTYEPLYGPDDEQTVIYPLDQSIATARMVLAEAQQANIHDAREMLRASVVLEMAIRGLLASLDAQADAS